MSTLASVFVVSFLSLSSCESTFDLFLVLMTVSFMFTLWFVDRIAFPVVSVILLR